MFRPIAAFTSLTLIVLLTTCSLQSYRPTVLVTSRLEGAATGAGSRLTNPALNAMDCYLVLFSAPGFDDFTNGDTGNLDHTCLRLSGRSSALVSYDAIRNGVSSSLPLGSYAVEILGLYRNGSSSCAGQTVRQVFGAGGTPSVFSLATRSMTSFSGATSLPLSATYDAGTAVNLATSCAGNITRWAFVDGNAANGLNHNSGGPAQRPRLVAHDAKLYLLWDEDSSGAVKQIRVQVYNGSDSAPVWSFVDGNMVTGINYSVNESASALDTISFNGTLYATWQEAGGPVSTIRVKAYNGNDASPSWSLVDGGTLPGLNHDSTRTATKPTFAINASKLYLTWTELNNSAIPDVRVAKYNGLGSWSFVDGNGANGLNYAATKAANSATLMSFNGKLYLFWDEASVIRAKVYNGNDQTPIWSSVEMNVTGGGLNYSAIYAASNARPAMFNGKLYLMWQELAANGIYQIRTAVYNGNDGAPAWSFVDAGQGFGLNHSLSQTAEFPALIPFGTTLYASWGEYNSAPSQIRNVRYNGNDLSPTWSFTDGNSGTGLNHTPSFGAHVPRGATFNSKLYLTWNEDGPNTSQIRVVVGQ